mgnify:FL=1
MKHPSKIKVIQLIPELTSGGVERGTLEVAKYLVSKGHESLVVSNGGEMVQQLVEYGSRHFELKIHKKSLFSLLEILKLRNLFLRERPDLVHARSRVPAWLTFLTLKTIPPQLRPKFVTTVHGFYSVNAYSEIMMRGDAVICVSESIKNYVTQNYPKTKPSKIQIIHRGVCKNEFPSGFFAAEKWLTDWYSRYPQTKNKKILLLPGRITQLKGHADFLQLLNKLPVSYHGLIVGSVHSKRRKYYEELEKLVLELKIEDRVTFVEKSNYMRELYSICHATMSLSKKPESFGRTVLESLSCGCPVVGYDHGGVGEILGECWQVGAVPPNSLDALSDALSSFTHRSQDIIIPSYYHLDVMLRKELASYFKIIS